MRNVIVMVLLFGSMVLCGQADRTEIGRLMDDQVKAWNRGDIPAFMDAYWKSDSLRFIGSRGITYGWQNTLNNYLKSYDSPAKMGSLQFTILHFEDLSANSAVVTGRWALTRDKPVSGYFTLLWKKIAGKWVIVSDHTS